MSFNKFAPIFDIILCYHEKMANHDTSYKQLFSHPEMVRDLITGFVHEPWVKEIDFSTLEKMNASYVTEHLSEREDDIIWRVKFNDGWLYLYLLIEFQSTVDHYMAVRLGSYVHLLYLDLIKSKVVKKPDKLPPILPVVLYNGEQRWNAACNIKDLIVEVKGGLSRYCPAMHYYLIDEGSYDEAKLSTLKNLVAAMIRLENGETPAAMEQTLLQLFGWLEDTRQTDLGRSFIIWIKRVLKSARNQDNVLSNVTEISEAKAMLSQRVEEWTKSWEARGFQQGIEQGIEKGIAKGIEQERNLLVRLAKCRFKTFNIREFEIRLSKISTPDKLGQVAEWIVICGSFTELCEKMDRP